MSKLKDLINTAKKANPEGSTLRQAISQARQGESVNVVPREINPVMEIPRFEPVTRSSATSGKRAAETSADRVRQRLQQETYSPLDRANDIVQGGLRQWASGIGTGIGNVLDRTTSRYSGDAAREWADLVQDYAGSQDKDSYFDQPENRARLESVQEIRERTSPLAQEIYEIAAETGRQGTEQVERAKSDLGAAGSFAVDVAVQVPQMLADAAFGAVTGGNALLPMGFRSYGSGVQEAMEAGADRDQAAAYGVARGAVDTATEKIFNVALPLARL